MNPQTQGTSSSLADQPLKRKRGRPRKDEGQVQMENVSPIPAVDSMKKDKQCVATIVDEMVGQAVSGVIEGSFDAGYLLKVKLGDSDTLLRGVVFLPGKFTPISASTDIAPQAKMYRRTEMPIPVLNPPTQVPSPVLSSDHISKQTVMEPQNLAPVQIQGVSSELQSNVLIATANQPTCSMHILPDLPMGHDKVPIFTQQKFSVSGLGSQSSSGMIQLVQGKVPEHYKMLKEFECSMAKISDIQQGATEEPKSLPQSTPSVVNLELQIQNQAASNELKPTQPIHDEMKRVSLEPNQVPVTTEPIGMEIWMKKQASPDKAALPDNSEKTITENDTSHTNGTPLDTSQSATESVVTGFPLMPFKLEALSSTPRHPPTEESSPRRINEPQIFSSSGSTNIIVENSATAPVTTLPVTLFERGSIPEPKLAMDGTVLPRITESLFCSTSGATNNVDCNIKDAIPPAES